MAAETLRCHLCGLHKRCGDCVEDGLLGLVVKGRIDCRLKRLISSRSTFWSSSLRDCGHAVLKSLHSFLIAILATLSYTRPLQASEIGQEQTFD